MALVRLLGTILFGGTESEGCIGVSVGPAQVTLSSSI